jgi:hypothetical protein
MSEPTGKITIVKKGDPVEPRILAERCERLEAALARAEAQRDEAMRLVEKAELYLRAYAHFSKERDVHDWLRDAQALRERSER